MTFQTYGRDMPGAAPGPDASYGAQDAGASAYVTAPEEGELGGILRWSGAFVSLALVVGMGYWGWQLATRDVREVPVVLALEGPMRVTPEAPGGADIPHQGLAVNAVQEARGATPVPDQLRVLEEPDSLTSEDLVPAAVLREDASAAGQSVLAENNLSRIDRLVAQAVAEGAELETVSLPQSEVRQPQALPEAEPALAIVPGGIGLSPRPAQRPDDLSAARVVRASLTTPEVPAPQTPPVAEGSRLVQLGAFDSAERAQDAWMRLQAGEFGPLLAGKRKLVQEAVAGGRTFYRLRAAGFADLDDARRFCAALKSGRADCIPVRAR